MAKTQKPPSTDDEGMFRHYLLNVLKESLNFSVDRGDFTNPNERIVTVKFDDIEVTSFSFNVVQEKEYDDY